MRTLVVDGGDGTIRDVLTIGLAVFGKAMPAIAIIPSGKTNALAHDLGTAPHRSLTCALAPVGQGRRVTRFSIKVVRESDGTPLHGFLFGHGALVRATALAQCAHRLGLFNGMAIGVAVGSVIIRTLFGSNASVWRSGEKLEIARPGTASVALETYALLATTLTRFLLGLAPFGRAGDGLQNLLIEAPPRRILRSLGPLLRGMRDDRLANAGYHRWQDQELRFTTDCPFILDGEQFQGGDIRISCGPPFTFIV